MFAVDVAELGHSCHLPRRVRMKYLFPLVALLVCSVSSTAIAKPREETLFLFENRRISILVPDGFGFGSTKDDQGLMTVHLEHPKENVQLTITFVPDPEQNFASARSRKELIHEQFGEYVGSSVEKAIQFEELEPKQGSGTYCVFTDAKLVGKTKLPPGEFLHLTSGVKAWPGVAAIFRMFSNDVRAKEHQAIIAMLRDSVEEKTLSPLL